MIVKPDTNRNSQKDHSSDVPSLSLPELILCSVNEPLALAWSAVTDRMNSISAARSSRPVRSHQGSILEVTSDAVVSPANSFGWMRGGIDASYLEAFPQIEDRVRSTVLAYHGGELPVGEAIVVSTGREKPGWLISAPTMREPTETLPQDTVHPFLAAKAVFSLWRDGLVEPVATSPESVNHELSGGENHEGQTSGGLNTADRVRIREIVKTIAMPGLGTGIGGVSTQICAHQVAAAWEEVFG